MHVHAGETGADDHRIERTGMLRLGVLIRHAFSEVFSGISGLPGMWGYIASVSNLFQRHSVRNRGAAGKRVIAVGRLPIPGDDALG
jgi:hypothetical protein